MTSRLLCALAAATMAVAPPRALAAQTEYYDLDAGRPTRVEDASPTERSELEIQLAPIRLEWVDGGMQRWRTEPKLSYGVLPFTEIELRLPLLMVQPPGAAAARSIGLSGVSLGALHALATETRAVPALALAVDVLLPVGGLAPSRTSYLARALATKTTTAARFHANVALGTYAVRVAQPSRGLTCPGDAGCEMPPVIVDTPCNVVLGDGFSPASAQPPGAPRAARCMQSGSAIGSAAVPRYDPTRTHGARWSAGLAADRAFPLASTLVAAAVTAERFVGLYGVTDWTAELGMRRQASPRLVLDLGVARHFAGVAPSTSITAGATLALSLGRAGEAEGR